MSGSPFCILSQIIEFILTFYSFYHQSSLVLLKGGEGETVRSGCWSHCNCLAISRPCVGSDSCELFAYDNADSLTTTVIVCPTALRD